MAKKINLFCNKKAQIALWVILAVLIFALLLLLLFNRPKPAIISQDLTNPQPIIESCARKTLSDALTIMMPQGGFLEPQNYKLYKNQKVTYLCENIGYYEPCINQHPAFLEEVKEELLKYAEDNLDFCFENVKKELEERNTQVSLGEMKLDIEMAPNKVLLKIDRKMTLNKDQSAVEIKNFEVNLAHPAYNLIMVANEIASQESKYCYFEYLGYMLLYPQYDIRKIILSESTKIYSIRDIKSNQELKIAIRGCAIPAGM